MAEARQTLEEIFRRPTQSVRSGRQTLEEIFNRPTRPSFDLARPTGSLGRAAAVGGEKLARGVRRAFTPRETSVEVRRAFEKEPILTKAPPIVTGFGSFGARVAEFPVRGVLTLGSELANVARQAQGKEPIREFKLPFSAKRLDFEGDKLTSAFGEQERAIERGESPLRS